MKSITTIYKVYGCNDEGTPTLSAEFLDLKEACQYAVAQEGKIHYYLPPVEKYTYVYDTETKEVDISHETIEPARIHYMNQI